MLTMLNDKLPDNDTIAKCHVQTNIAVLCSEFKHWLMLFRIGPIINTAISAA